MMQGISSLPGAQQPQQLQQAPGQAMPFQAMPAQQPQTPMGMTGQLEKLPPQQLLQMFANPADKTPKWAVVTAYAKAIEQQRLEQLASGQQAMQQNQMQAQQPPVAAQVMMQQPTQMARHGGIMHGYSGGGAVAFQSGKVALERLPGETEEEYKRRQAEASAPSKLTAEQFRALSPEMRQRLLQIENDRRLASGIAKITGAMVGSPAIGAADLLIGGPYNVLAGAATDIANRIGIPRLGRALGIYDPSVTEVEIPRIGSGSATPFAEMVRKGIESHPSQISTDVDFFRQLQQSEADQARATPSAAPPASPAAAPAASPAAPEKAGPPAARQPAAAAPTRGFPGPQESPELRRRLDEQNRIAREQAKLTDEERAARGGLDALSAQIIAERRAEEARRLAQAETRMGEAKARAERNPLEDVAFIGQMLKGARGARTFGAGISGAGIGAGEAETARREALRKAEEKYDLTRNEIANLANLRQQLQIDQARVVEARASGDANKIRAAEMQAAASGVELAKYEQDLGLRARGFELEEMKIKAQREQTAAASMQFNQQKLISLLNSTEVKKQQLVNDITKEHMKNKEMVYKMADIANAPKEAIAAKRAADKELADKIREKTADLDRLMAQTAAQIPGFGSLYQAPQLPPGVTVQRTGP